ncbi:uncharacterized protein LOC126839983 [Adelges cooleyi]|uniref:uncharacterized protein LOC126839983 n=1 Tax=Adelges cooleyi TaxID=133065 RepID=UPI0021801B0F|nr:uncharacterized protein LOC126839983 [Adelges cooleyi]
MIQPLLFVYSLLSVCIFLMCSAGKPVSWSHADNVSTLNNILQAKGWKVLVAEALDQELKSIDGKVMDLSDLLNKETDGNIVTPANYTDKLLKSSTAVNCFYCEKLKFMNDIFIEVIGVHCMSLDSDSLKLDCMERFWETMDIHKSWIEKMLVVLNFFHDASKNMGTTTPINALEFLLPHYDRQKYTKSNYLDDNDTVKIDNFRRVYGYFQDHLQCANQILQDFLTARCLPSFNDQNEKSKYAIDLEEMTYHATHQDIDKVFRFYVKCLYVYEKTFSTNLGFVKELLLV